jgi:diguanylate cyclase (GGDEF)-like protein/PAS domain S-box-containing protein
MPRDRKTANVRNLDLDLLDRITDGLVALDQEWRFVFLNAPAAEILSRDRQEVLGKNIWDEFPMLVSEPFYQACQEAMARQAQTQIERYSSKRERWIENRIFPSPNGLTILFTKVTERKKMEASLCQYRDIFNLAEVGLVISTDDGAAMQAMNPAFARMHGYEVKELVGRPTWEVYAPEVRDQIPDLICRTNERGHYVYESLHLHRDGTVFPVSVDATAVRGPQGDLLYHIVNVTDITERNLSQAATAAATLRLETLIANIQAGVIVEDSQGQLVLVNQSFCDMMGLSLPPAALIGANIPQLARQSSLLFPDPDAFIARALDLRLRHEAQASEELTLADGRVWERDYVPVFPGNQGYGGHLWLFRDITVRKRIEQQVRDSASLLAAQKAELENQKAELEKANGELAAANTRLEVLATTDGLTGLLNHRVFTERIQEEWRRAQRYAEPLSLMMIDLDGFKVFNDVYGHLQGNAVLQQAGIILAEEVRETDILARYGGEEFAVILPHTVGTEAAAIAERIRAAFASYDWKLRLVTVSIGVCELSEVMADAAALIHDADMAMYQSKAAGRNKVTLRTR